MTLVQSIKEERASGEENIGDWLPLCDVSGSMTGTPMDVAIALSLLMAESSCVEGNIWAGKVMTFEENPRIVNIDGIPKQVSKEEFENIESFEEQTELLGDLGQRVLQLREMSWGCNTNIERAFDEIIKICIENKLSTEKVRNFRLCIFSDMEFDEAIEDYEDSEDSDIEFDEAQGSERHSWETMHDVIEKKFRIAGYPEMPTIVYWNLRPSRSIPIHDTNKPGVSLLSGFSAGLMRKFLSGQLDEDADVQEIKAKQTPMETLLKIVDSEMYENLKVAEDDLPMMES